MEKYTDRKTRKSLESWNDYARMRETANKVKAYLIITVIVSSIVFILSLFGIR